jgi:hypothetical protein
VLLERQGLRLRNISSAAISFRRVSCGSIPSSRVAELRGDRGLANVSLYSATSAALGIQESAARASSSRNRMFTAPSAPMTAISAEGQAML